MKCSDKNCSKDTGYIDNFYLSVNFEPPKTTVKNCGNCKRPFCGMHLVALVIHKDKTRKRYNPPICSDCLKGK